MTKNLNDLNDDWKWWYLLRLKMLSEYAVVSLISQNLTKDFMRILMLKISKHLGKHFDIIYAEYSFALNSPGDFCI